MDIQHEKAATNGRQENIGVTGSYPLPSYRRPLSRLFCSTRICAAQQVKLLKNLNKYAYIFHTMWT